MRRVLCLVAFLLAATASAQEKPKPNTLTPKEIADGWVLLFDGETTFGWKTDGAAEVKDGVLVVGKGKPSVICPTTHFREFTLAFEMWGAAELFEGNRKLSLRADGQQPKEPRAQVEVWRSSVGVGHFAGGVSIIQTDVKEPRLGLKTAPFVIETDGKTEFRIRNVKLQPKDTTSLFNGKDLTGWKVFPGDKYKSKFAVTAAGELSVKDGPGDLQTDKAYGDFVLQLECKTNGKALNSGVFFRCLADQYQQGYEAQIQNAFVGDDRTKPTDFGTGAIYRRVAARKVVSNDNEWFTMTVVADEKHISTWVNGYQTVDWTDDRPADESARKGYRAGKGHLSIQGHDPTTDLLFRNIRVAELK